MIPFHRPSIGEEEIAEVVDTLRSGWLTTGQKVKGFEKAFAAEVINMLRERGIGTSVHFIPLHLHPAYGDSFGYKCRAFPVAERAFDRAVSLAIYPSMTDRDVEHVVESVRDISRHLRR